MVFTKLTTYRFYTDVCPECKRVHHIDEELEPNEFYILHNTEMDVTVNCKCGNSFAMNTKEIEDD